MDGQVETQPFSEIGEERKALHDRCLRALCDTIRNEQKMAERKTFLSVHPEARRKIDTTRLRQIVDYLDFKCHPQCSIARDKAVAGSDIDGALVVLKSEVPLEQQLAFVEELRRQGFSAFHPTEVQARERELNEARAKGIEPWSKESREVTELIRRFVEARNAEIRFYTVSQLEEMKKRPLDDPVIIYVAGHSIK